MTSWLRLSIHQRWSSGNWWLTNWWLTNLQHGLVKTGGRLAKHARYYWLMLAEGHLTRELFAATVGSIAALPTAIGWGAAAETQTGRRNEGDGGVHHKSPEMRHFRVLLYPDEPELATPGPPESFGIGTVGETAPMEAAGVYLLLAWKPKRKSWLGSLDPWGQV